MTQLKNKVAFITGGSKGIGLGIAHTLMAQGMNVFFTARGPGSISVAEKELNNGDYTGKAHGLVCDVTNFNAMQQAAAACVDAFGAIDALIANAGVGHFAPIEEMTPEQWRETMDINLTGVFNTVKSGLKPLKESKGYIITISSLAGTNFFPAGAAYNASKFGLTGFTQAIMLDLRKYGVKVSTIMPGSVSTHFNGHEPSEKDAWKIQPEDIGQLVLDLLEMNPRTLPSKIEVRPTTPPSK